MNKKFRSNKALFKAIISVTCSFVLLFAISACSSNYEEVKQEVKTWPLTHLQTDNIVDRPAVAVKIENSLDARPQIGLEDADVVWEELVEGGITRFMAVYNSKLPKLVEPVRSVRPMDTPMAAPLKGILAFSGGQPQFIDRANKAGIQTVSPSQSNAFDRDNTRYAPHNQTLNVEELIKIADANHNAAPTPMFEYAGSDEEVTAFKYGEDVKAIVDTFSTSSITGWEYNADKKVFERTQDGDLFSSANGTRIVAKNVLSLEVDVQNSGALDPAGNGVPETVLSGASGNGKLSVNGKVINVKWSKASDSDNIVLKTEIKKDDGSTEEVTVQLAAGNTWIDLVPKTGSIKVSK